MPNHYIRIKVCGLRSPEHAIAAADAGADAIGLVFVGKSPRFVSTSEAKAVALSVGPLVSKVALFVNPTVREVEEVLASVPIDVLQFHGEESVAFCEQFQRPYLKALRVRSLSGDADQQQQQALREAASSYQHLLLDAYSDKAHGGTGERFDWRCLPADGLGQWILAGGLAPENVAEAIAATHPYGVDVSSGVETAPGEKSSEKIFQFVEAARQSLSP